MITKEEFEKLVKSKEKLDIDSKFKIIEYYLKNEANLILDSMITGIINIHTSQIILLPIKKDNEKKVKLLEYSFNKITEKYEK